MGTNPKSKIKYDKEYLVKINLSFSKKSNPELDAWLKAKPNNISASAYVRNALKEYIRTL